MGKSWILNILLEWENKIFFVIGFSPPLKFYEGRDRHNKQCRQTDSHRHIICSINSQQWYHYAPSIGFHFMFIFSRSLWDLWGKTNFMLEYKLDLDGVKFARTYMPKAKLKAGKMCCFRIEIALFNFNFLPCPKSLECQFLERDCLYYFFNVYFTVFV